MDLLTTLVLGSYGWTLLATAYLEQRIRQLEANHLAHIERRLVALEQAGKEP